MSCISTDPTTLASVNDNDIAGAFDRLDEQHEMTFLGDKEDA